jgi:hypothetical protein
MLADALQAPDLPAFPSTPRASCPVAPADLEVQAEGGDDPVSTSSLTVGSPVSTRCTDRTPTLATSASLCWSRPWRRRSSRMRRPIRCDVVAVLMCVIAHI